MKRLSIVLIFIVACFILVFSIHKMNVHNNFKEIYTTIDDAYENKSILSDSEINKLAKEIKDNKYDSLKGMLEVYKAFKWHETGEDNGTPIVPLDVRDTYYKQFKEKAKKQLASL